MRLPAHSLDLVRRDNKNNNNGGSKSSSTAFIAIAVTVVVVITLTVGLYAYLRRLRRTNSNPKYVPTEFLKKKWKEWQPQAKYGHIGRNSGRDSRSVNTEYNAHASTQDESASAEAAAAGVDRNTSVRSVMTLPAYSPAPKETEQVIGREGERAGMDTVVEFPETADDEEARREEQMESLYQIRLQRRQEIAEREQRRQERREARARGDFARLEELRLESQQRSQGIGVNASANNSSATLPTNLTSQIMMAEHQSRGRDRRVSSVSYAEVGQVRHDGTRIRGNSEDSDHRPLLDSAAPMGAEPRTSVGSSLFEPPRPSFHSRDRSASSALSISTTASDLENPPEPTPPSTSNDGGQSSQHPSSGSDPATSPDATRDTPPGSDIGESQIPAPEPPSYDHHEWGEAPAYESPVATRGEGPSLERQPTQGPPRLPQLTTLPSISIETATEPNTPSSPVRRQNSTSAR